MLDSVNIAIASPQEFDGLTKAQVLTQREKQMKPYEGVLVRDYTPLQEVFGAIKDGKPWWGISGQFYYGKSDKSPEGLSEESRWIVNPYFLVTIEFFGYTIWGGDFKWDPKVTPSLIEKDVLPLVPLPDKLVWYPRQKRAEAHYPLSAWLKKMKPFIAVSPPLERNWVSFHPTNARDLGLNYFWVDWNQSDGIDRSEKFQEATFINRYIHLGGSCGYPGACNNESPSNSGLDDYRLSKLPAIITIKLWHNQPLTTSEIADMVFTISID